MNLKPYWAYFCYVFRHKVAVFKECWKLGLFWRGITHDLSKFSPAEFGAYARHFYDEKGAKKPFDHQQDTSFDYALNDHLRRESHHWQHWILLHDDGVTKALPIPEKDRLEMLADWLSFGGYGRLKEWYQRNKGKMILHPETRAWIEVQLGLEEEGSGRYQRPVKNRYKRTFRIRR